MNVFYLLNVFLEASSPSSNKTRSSKDDDDKPLLANPDTEDH